MIDRKFIFVATNPCNKKVYTEENAMIFCAKDAALLPALECYRLTCQEMGCGEEHLESIDLMIGRVRQFQFDVEIRTPDTHTELTARRDLLSEIRDVDPHLYRFEIG